MCVGQVACVGGKWRVWGASGMCVGQVACVGGKWHVCGASGVCGGQVACVGGKWRVWGASGMCVGQVACVGGKWHVCGASGVCGGQVVFTWGKWCVWVEQVECHLFIAALTSSDSLRVLTRKVVRFFQVQPVVQLSHFNGLYTEERRGEEGRGREGTERGGKERRWRTGEQHEEERQTHRVLQWARTLLTPLAHGLVELDQEIKVLAFPKECLSLFLQVRTNGMYHTTPTPHPLPTHPPTHPPTHTHTHTHTYSPPTPHPLPTFRAGWSCQLNPLKSASGTASTF